MPVVAQLPVSKVNRKMKALTLRIVSCWILSSLALLSTGWAQAPNERPKDLVFGAIADCQYCADPGKGVRKYALSRQKLTKCVDHLNKRDLSFVVHLGDFIDRDFESFDVVGPIFGQLKMPRYHVLGNHDFSVAEELKRTVPQKLGLPSRYYDFKVGGWRMVALDGNDISFHAHPRNSDRYRVAEHYYREKGIQAPKWNGAVGPEQLSWLRSVLEKATRTDERVLIFCHFPVYPSNVHNLWNAEEVVALLEAYPCVKAYINGHNHEGHYAVKEGIHYLTLKGMVDTETSSYAVIHVDDEVMRVEGHGREIDRTLKFMVNPDD